MIEIRCNTRKEYRVINHLISTGLLNTPQDDIKDIAEIVGDKLKINYHIKENKKRWWRKKK